MNTTKDKNVCPKCGSKLTDTITTPTGRLLRRCSSGEWDSQTKKNIGCDYVLWLETPPKKLEEKCPKCGKHLVFVITKYGKKLKKCSTNRWDEEKKESSGCDYVEFIRGTTEKLDEDCPECGEPLVLYTSAKGKKLKKCSTSKWDPETKKSSGCTYIQWVN